MNELAGHIIISQTGNFAKGINLRLKKRGEELENRYSIKYRVVGIGNCPNLNLVLMCFYVILDNTTICPARYVPLTDRLKQLYIHILYIFQMLKSKNI